MKKYKLIKRFLNSPELGFEVTTDDEGLAQMSYINMGHHVRTIFKPTDWPESWEEVKDLEKPKENPESKFSQLRKNWNKLLANFNVKEVEEEFKADFDNLLKTIEPKVEKFLKEELDKIIRKNYEEKPKRLFVTEDGAPIYYGRVNLYSVNKKYFSLGRVYAESIDDTNVLLYFLSEENAKQWIKENKPEFSRKQIQDVFDRAHITGLHGYELGKYILNLLTNE